MAKRKPKHSDPITCGHCGNVAPMEVLATAERDESEIDECNGQMVYLDVMKYEVLLCPACRKPVLRSTHWCSEMSDDEPDVAVLYPQSSTSTHGFPSSVRREYELAMRVRHISTSAYGTHIRRMLDAVCDDQKAEGKDLFEQLNDLSAKGVIPETLAKVASGLRRFGNIGAHASLGELLPEQVPLLERLTSAILEFVYTAPRLAEEAERQLELLKALNAPPPDDPPF